jgi:alpha-aminoadipate carrier protein LysW
MKDMAAVYCPECDARISLNPHATLGQKLVCPECEADLEVISVDPVELDWAYDWSWDEDEEDEDDDDW